MRAKALPWLLSTAALLGLLWPGPGRLAAAWSLHGLSLAGWLTALIFLASGWQLDLRSLRREPWGRSLGLAILLNLGLGPCLGWALLQSMPAAWLASGLGLGLGIVASSPTTVNTGLSLAAAGGGHLGLAVLLTTGLILGSLFTLPLVLPWLIPSLAGSGVGAGVILQLLCWQMLLPLGLGQVLRSRVLPPAGSAWIQPLGVAVTIWLTVSRQRLEERDWGWVPAALMAFLILRLSLLALAQAGARRLGLGPASARSFSIVASQKSVVLSVAILAQLPASFDSQLGAAALFCVLYHLAQAFWDASFVKKV